MSDGTGLARRQLLNSAELGYIVAAMEDLPSFEFD